MGARNFFNNYFYGRPGKGDYTEADQPKNRRELFREVLRARAGALMGANLLYLVFWLPAVFWSFLNLVQLNQPVAAAELAAHFDGLTYSYLLLLWPLVALTGPFNMGVSFVMRNWARDEHSFLLSDFKDALRANWKQGLLYGALSGFVPLALYLCARFYAGMAAASPLFYLPLAVVAIAAAVWFLTSPLLPTMIVTYRQSFGGLLKNAVLITLASLPRAIAARLGTLLLPMLVLASALFFPGALNWLAPISLVLYAVFLLGFNKLVWASYANALCERYLNPKIPGARTNIGLRNEDAEDRT